MHLLKLLIGMLAILYSTTLCADNANRRILFSGLSFHEKDYLDDGTKLNAYNVGIGYERDYFKEYGKTYYTYHTMMLSDSNKNFQIYAAGSESIRFEKPFNPWFDISVGLAGFISVKKMRQNNGEYKYRPIAAVAPVSSLYFDDYSLNFAYIPSYSFTDTKTVGFLYLYLGWQF